MNDKVENRVYMPLSEMMLMLEVTVNTLNVVVLYTQKTAIYIVAYFFYIICIHFSTVYAIVKTKPPTLSYPEL